MASNNVSISSVIESINTGACFKTLKGVVLRHATNYVNNIASEDGFISIEVNIDGAPHTLRIITSPIMKAETINSISVASEALMAPMLECRYLPEELIVFNPLGQKTRLDIFVYSETSGMSVSKLQKSLCKSANSESLERLNYVVRLASWFANAGIVIIGDIRGSIFISRTEAFIDISKRVQIKWINRSTKDETSYMFSELYMILSELYATATSDFIGRMVNIKADALMLLAKIKDITTRTTGDVEYQRQLNITAKTLSQNYSLFDDDKYCFSAIRDMEGDSKGHREGRMAVLFRETGLYGFTDYAGQIVIPCNWSFVNDFHEGIAIVGDRNKVGAINRYGETVVPAEWDELDWEYRYNIFIANRDGYNYLLSRKGTRLNLDGWRRISVFTDREATVEDDKGNIYTIDTNGEYVPEPL